MAGIFQSSRLIYRAVEADDVDLFVTLQSDAASFVNSYTTLYRPQSRSDAQAVLKHHQDSLLGVVICLPPPDVTSKAVPIGALSMTKLKEDFAHHRYTEIGVDIVKPYHGQGYGSEAINWALDWAFGTAGMHRVNISAFEYNKGARRLYERLGFKQEGVRRKMFWHAGKWWDDFEFGMLQSDWEELRQKDAVPEAS